MPESSLLLKQQNKTKLHITASETVISNFSEIDQISYRWEQIQQRDAKFRQTVFSRSSLPAAKRYSGGLDIIHLLQSQLYFCLNTSFKTVDGQSEQQLGLLSRM